MGRDKIICDRCGATAVTFYTQCHSPSVKSGCPGELKMEAIRREDEKYRVDMTL